MLAGGKIQKNQRYAFIPQNAAKLYRFD